MTGIRAAGLGIPTGDIITRLEKQPAQLGMSGHKFRLPAVAGKILEKSVTILREGVGFTWSIYQPEQFSTGFKTGAGAIISVWSKMIS